MRRCIYHNCHKPSETIGCTISIREIKTGCLSFTAESAKSYGLSVNCFEHLFLFPRHRCLIHPIYSLFAPFSTHRYFHNVITCGPSRPPTLREDSKFCDACGTKLSEKGMPPETPQSSSDMWSVLWEHPNK
eukprot:g53989.t1